MKVVKPGAMLFDSAHGVVMQGWQIDGEGNMKPTGQDILACVLDYIAEVGGLSLRIDTDPAPTLAVERDVAAIIDRARQA